MRRFRRAIGSRFRHARHAIVPIAQCAAAAGLAWWAATELLGHQRPFFAPIAAVVSLNGARRVHRAVELVVGVSVGVGIGDLLIGVIGSGAWQIALVVTLAMVAAVLLDGGPLIATQAGSSAVLVATLLPPGGSGGLERCIDALVGGAIGVLVIALLPADPAAPVRKAANALLDELATILRGISAAASAGDVDRAEELLERARGAEPLVDRLAETIRSASEITHLAPLRWSHRHRLPAYVSLAGHLDYALRNTRILARRVHIAARDREIVGSALSDFMSTLADAIDVMRTELSVGHDLTEAQAALLIAARSITATHREDHGFSEQVMLAQLRSTTVDLLQASGVDRDHARRAMQEPPPTA